ncbi:serine hydrolase domain-containing protein [Maricaulis sp. CAU 1757]
MRIGTGSGYVVAVLWSFIGLVCVPFAAAQAPDVGLDCERAEAVHRRGDGVALLVVQRGQPVCEWFASHVSADQAWPVASGVKSFAGVMAVVAEADGLLSLDEPVASTLVEWRNEPARAAVTIAHLLHQTSGLAPTRSRRLRGYQDAVEAPLVHAPGSRFSYDPRHFAVFGEVLRRKLEAGALDATPAHYLARRVLAPAGVRIADWVSIEGQPVLSEGVTITPVDWLLFGDYVLQAARRSEGYARMFQGSAANPAYGLGWWLIRPDRALALDWSDADELPAHFPAIEMAGGAGGQRLYLVRELDVVIVRMTRGGAAERQAEFDGEWSDRRFLEALLGPAVQPARAP